MPFARQQPGCRIETDPTRTRQVDFRPRMEVGENHGRTGRTIEGGNVRRELNEITRDKTSGESNMARNLNKQPAGIAARPRPFAQCLFRWLDARFHADQIFDVLLQVTVEIAKKIDRSCRRSIEPVQICLQSW